MAKLTVVFKTRELANIWLAAAKQLPGVQGGNVYHCGSFRGMIYGDITPEMVEKLKRGRDYKYEP